MAGLARPQFDCAGSRQCDPILFLKSWAVVWDAILAAKIVNLSCRSN